MKLLIKLLYVLIQMTWGLIQNIVGIIGYLIFSNCIHYTYKESVVTIVPGKWGGVSLGMFIFISDGVTKEDAPNSRVVNHEYGHTLQSLMLGPLFFIIIGIPSGIWYQMDKYRSKHNLDYYSLYCEKWANELGGVDKCQK